MPRFAHHRLEAYHAALGLAEAGHRLALVDGDGAALVLARADRTAALLKGLVKKFA
jgi:hypothetical protein